VSRSIDDVIMNTAKIPSAKPKVADPVDDKGL